VSRGKEPAGPSGGVSVELIFASTNGITREFYGWAWGTCIGKGEKAFAATRRTTSKRSLFSFVLANHISTIPHGEEAILAGVSSPTSIEWSWPIF